MKTGTLLIAAALMLCGMTHAKDELSFKEQTIPAKVPPTQESVMAAFHFTNTSTETVTIRKVDVSCDCTTAKIKDNKLTYAPGESGTISAVMKTGNFSGTVDKDMTVITDRGEYKLVIRALITDIIKMEPRKLEWAKDEAPTPKTIHITISQELPLNLTAVDLTGDDFNYEPVTVRKGKEYKIIVTPKNTKEGAFNTIWVRTDCAIPRYKKQMGFLIVKPK